MACSVKDPPVQVDVKPFLVKGVRSVLCETADAVYTYTGRLVEDTDLSKVQTGRLIEYVEAFMKECNEAYVTLDYCRRILHEAGVFAEEDERHSCEDL